MRILLDTYKCKNMDDIEQIKDIIVSEINPEKIILFGSRARGDYDTDSDYDILVLKHGITNGRKLSGDVKIKFYQKRLLLPIDVIVMEHDRFVSSISKCNFLGYI